MGRFLQPADRERKEEERRSGAHPARNTGERPRPPAMSSYLRKDGRPLPPALPEQRAAWAMGVQRTLGNQATGALIRAQAKLAIGSPGDAFEVEADEVADRVMRTEEPPAAWDGAAPEPAGDVLQRTCAACKDGDEDDDDDALHRKAEGASGGGMAAPPIVHDVLGLAGQPLDAPTRAFMQPRFGYDFGEVRVHADARAAESARAVDALAYTVGRDIVFGAGRYEPSSPEGRRLLAHELTHVVQQGGDAAALQRAVVATPVNRLNRLQLLGDGTPANPGIPLGTFQGYISNQADWFTEPTLTGPDRDLLWKLALLLQEGDHIGAALGNVPVAELGATSSADMVYVRKYADGGKSTPDTVRITSPDTTVARVIALGRAMADLAAFVPAPVQRIVFDQTGLGTMVDQSLVGTLKDYYTDFTPTLENPAEQAPLLALLSGGLTAFAPLKGWVHDLHVFTPKTRTQLVANVADRSRREARAAHPHERPRLERRLPPGAEPGGRGAQQQEPGAHRPGRERPGRREGMGGQGRGRLRADPDGRGQGAPRAGRHRRARAGDLGRADHARHGRDGPNPTSRPWLTRRPISSPQRRETPRSSSSTSCCCAWIRSSARRLRGLPGRIARRARDAHPRQRRDGGRRDHGGA